jgi:hypothetical protein
VNAPLVFCFLENKLCEAAIGARIGNGSFVRTVSFQFSPDVAGAAKVGNAGCKCSETFTGWMSPLGRVWGYFGCEGPLETPSLLVSISSCTATLLALSGVNY